MNIRKATIVAAKYLFFAFFLALLAAILYVAQMLSR